MTNAKNLARELREAAAERQVVALIGERDNLAAVVSIGHANGRDGLGLPCRVFGAQLEFPGGDCASHCLAKAIVPGVDIG